MDPGQAVEDLLVSVTILENKDITLLKVPRLRNDIDAVDEGTGKTRAWLSHAVQL